MIYFNYCLKKICLVIIFSYLFLFRPKFLKRNLSNLYKLLLNRMQHNRYGRGRQQSNRQNQQPSLLPNNQELITHIIEHIFAEYYLFGKSKKTSLKPLSNEVTGTINYMNRNLDKKIDMDQLASRVFLSHSGLIWKFKKELNTTPLHYLNLLRLRYAKQLLLTHPYNITQISELCGYSNPFYFTNLFHKHTGMSPTEFRKFHTKDS